MICPECFEPIEDDDMGACPCILDGLGTRDQSGLVKPKTVGSSPMRDKSRLRWGRDLSSPIEIALKSVTYGQRAALERVGAGLPIKPASHRYLHARGFIEGAASSPSLSALGKEAVGVLQRRKRGGKEVCAAPSGGE